MQSEASAQIKQNKTKEGRYQGEAWVVDAYIFFGLVCEPSLTSFLRSAGSLI
jgi:hypothetical protein